MSEILEAPNAPFRLTSPIDRITELGDGTLLVHAVVTSETPDSQGEIIDYDAFRKAAGDFMEWPALKEMHDQDSAAGTILRLYFDDDRRVVEGDLHVVDPVAVKKVLAKVYRAVSVGGMKRAIKRQLIGGRWYRRIVDLVADELSLADRPANRDAVIAKAFVIAKRDSKEPGMDAPEDRTVQQLAIDAAREPDPEAIAVDEPLGKADDASGEVIADGLGAVEDPEGGTADVEAAAAAGAIDTAEEEAGETIPTEEALAKTDPAPEPAAAPVAVVEPLHKTANGVVDALQGALSSVVYAIGCEAAEGDTADVEKLQAIANALQAAIIDEAAEPPTPAEALAEAVEDAIEAVASPVDEVLYVSYGRQAELALERYAGASRRFGKAGKRNAGADQDRIDRMHDLTVDLGTSRHADGAEAAPDDGAEADDGPIAKADADTFIERITAILGTVIPADKIVAIEERLATQGATLDRMAKTEAGGGPATPFAQIFAAADRGQSPELLAHNDRAAVLSAAAGVIDDPNLRSQVGEAAALAQIRSARGG